MAKQDVIDILQSRQMDPFAFNFDALTIPPMQAFLSPQDVEALRQIATSARLSSKIDKKYKMIDDIMTARGFKRFSAGTNRVVYKFMEDYRFLVKIAVDKVGMQDNPMEFKNQFLLQPFVTKMFYISPCGTVGFAERVMPIKNIEEFKAIAPDVFDVITLKILGKYVVEDIGTKYFMNWGVRKGFGPVLLDYPYVYQLDGKKLFCTSKVENPITREKEICNGEIDYDVGFNALICSKCGKRYLARDLRVEDNSKNNKIVIKGGSKMRVKVIHQDGSVYETMPTKDFIGESTPSRKPGDGHMRVSLIGMPIENGFDDFKNDVDNAKPTRGLAASISCESANQDAAKVVSPKEEEEEVPSQIDTTSACASDVIVEVENDSNEEVQTIDEKASEDETVETVSEPAQEKDDKKDSEVSSRIVPMSDMYDPNVRTTDDGVLYHKLEESFYGSAMRFYGSTMRFTIGKNDSEESDDAQEDSSDIETEEYHDDEDEAHTPDQESDDEDDDKVYTPDPKSDEAVIKYRDSKGRFAVNPNAVKSGSKSRKRGNRCNVNSSFIPDSKKEN